MGINHRSVTNMSQTQLAEFFRERPSAAFGNSKEDAQAVIDTKVTLDLMRLVLDPRHPKGGCSHCKIF